MTTLRWVALGYHLALCFMRIMSDCGGDDLADEPPICPTGSDIVTPDVVRGGYFYRGCRSIGAYWSCAFTVGAYVWHVRLSYVWASSFNTVIYFVTRLRSTSIPYDELKLWHCYRFRCRRLLIDPN